MKKILTLFISTILILTFFCFLDGGSEFGIHCGLIFTESESTLNNFFIEDSSLSSLSSLSSSSSSSALSSSSFALSSANTYTKSNGIFSSPNGAANHSKNISNSYVFQLSEDSTLSEIHGLSHAKEICEEICADARIYRTDDANLIKELERNNCISQYALDGIISLDGLSRDFEELDSQDYRSSMLGYSYPKGKNITGEGVKIAIIDSGLWTSYTNYSSATILTGTNFLVDSESEDRTNVEDTYGHGTFVASIICGNDIGLAPNVTILPLKCFDGKTSNYSYVIEAINKAIEEDCDIINLSLGDTVQYPLLEEAVQSALDNGIIVVASSGNISSLTPSTGNDELRYPASHQGVISVGAVDNTKTVWKKSVQNSSVCVVAPGVSSSGLSLATGQLVVNNGTSFAAPIVSATAALALSVDSTLSVTSFTNLLISTAEDLGAIGKDNSYGNGLINPALLLATLCQDNEAIIPSSWDGKHGVSAYLASGDIINLVSLYNEYGQMVSVSIESKLCNYQLSSDTNKLSIFSIDSTNSAPKNAARTYE